MLNATTSFIFVRYLYSPCNKEFFKMFPFQAEGLAEIFVPDPFSYGLVFVTHILHLLCLLVFHLKFCQ